MVIYLAFVAIMNLALGFLVSQTLHKAELADASALRQRPKSRNTKSKAAQTAGKSTPQSTDTSATKSDLKESLKSAETLTNDLTKEQRARAAAIESQSWSDFANQLREIKDRAQYCKTAQDKRLAQQAADQLRTCAQTWYKQVDKCLSGGELDSASQALMQDADTTAMEMLAAQCETSISNIDAIDYTATIDEVLAALDREVSLLDGEQQKVARSPAASTEVAKS